MTVKELGHYLRRQREARGWTQAHVARVAGIEQSQLSRLERGVGTAFPEPDVIAKLAGVFGVPPEDLMRVSGYTWDVAQNEHAPVLTMSEDDLRWHELPPHVRRMVKGMVDAFFAENEDEPEP